MRRRAGRLAVARRGMSIFLSSRRRSPVVFRRTRDKLNFVTLLTLLIVMVVAVVSTKVPILVGHDVGPFHLAADIKRVGFWSAQHEAGADLTMFLGLMFLLIVGAGRWSLDARLSRRVGKQSSFERSQ